MVADGNWTLGGKHTTEYTDVKLQCTPENYIIVLTNVTPINLIKKKIILWHPCIPRSNTILIFPCLFPSALVIWFM